MTDELRDESHPADGGTNTVRNVLLALAAVFVLGSLYMMFEMSGRIEKLEQRQTAAETSAAELGKTLSSVRSEFKANSDALASKVGMTQKQLASRSAALQKEQQEAEARLSEQQKQQITAVAGDVAGVKSEVGTVKTDVASTRTELEATKSKLERTIGDLGMQSGLIAKTRDDLEVLKHRGDRNYYEFSLSKAKKPTPVGTVSLELKKADPKKGKYTLNVVADDKAIEKKDKNVSEPVQFYSGRDHQLFELVVFTIAKDHITGYLSTPKNAPVPIETGKAQ